MNTLSSAVDNNQERIKKTDKCLARKIQRHKISRQN